MGRPGCVSHGSLRCVPLLQLTAPGAEPIGTAVYSMYCRVPHVLQPMGCVSRPLGSLLWLCHSLYSMVLCSGYSLVLHSLLQYYDDAAGILRMIILSACQPHRLMVAPPQPLSISDAQVSSRSFLSLNPFAWKRKRGVLLGELGRLCHRPSPSQTIAGGCSYLLSLISYLQLLPLKK